jgi:hypothetical protein
MTAGAVLGVVLDVSVLYLDLIFFVGKVFAIRIVIYEAVFVKNVGRIFVRFSAAVLLTANDREKQRKG